MKNEKAADHSGDYATSVVPGDQRKGSINLFLTTAGWIICLSTMFTGGTLITGLSFRQSMIAAVIGMLILTVFSAPLAAIGSKFGVSTTMLTRHSLGRAGSCIFGIVNALLLGIGWFAWQAAFFGLTLAELLPNTFLVNPIIGALIGGVLMTLTAVYGYKGIAILSFIAVPLIIILSTFGGIAGIEQIGGWNALLATQSQGESFTLFAGITIVVGNAASGAVVLSDITRYAKTPKMGAIAAAAGYLFGGVFCILCGGAMAVAVNVPGIGTTPNLPAVMIAIGLGVGALGILILAQWTTNTANIYSGALGLGAFLPVKQKFIVLVMGVIGTILAISNIYALFVPFLMLLGTIIPPIAGVMLADYYVVWKLFLRQEYRFGAETEYAQFNWLAFLCIALGAVLAANIPFFTPAFMSIVYAFALYVILAAICCAVKIPYAVGKYVEKENGL
jgi:cytosine permease